MIKFFILTVILISFPFFSHSDEIEITKDEPGNGISISVAFSFPFHVAFPELPVHI